ncbi:hypothetical protein EI94DRAFT_1699679 [Lactarius quietus]|nr:hypothetical protein EI94DRAFT_1699679 [Lactarius quietus]
MTVTLSLMLSPLSAIYIPFLLLKKDLCSFLFLPLLEVFTRVRVRRDAAPQFSGLYAATQYASIDRMIQTSLYRTWRGVNKSILWDSGYCHLGELRMLVTIQDVANEINKMKHTSYHPLLVISYKRMPEAGSHLLTHRKTTSLGVKYVIHHTGLESMLLLYVYTSKYEAFISQRVAVEVAVWLRLRSLWSQSFCLLPLVVVVAIVLAVTVLAFNLLTLCRTHLVEVRRLVQRRVTPNCIRQLPRPFPTPVPAIPNHNPDHNNGNCDDNKKHMQDYDDRDGATTAATTTRTMRPGWGSGEGDSDGGSASV